VHVAAKLARTAHLSCGLGPPVHASQTNALAVETAQGLAVTTELSLDTSHESAEVDLAMSGVCGMCGESSLEASTQAATMCDTLGYLRYVHSVAQV